MRLKLFFLLLFFSYTVGAQTKCDCFDRLYNLSMHYYFAKDWPMAINSLKDAISFLEPGQREGDYYYLLAEDYSHDNKIDSAINYFTKAIALGYPVSSVIESYPNIFYKIDSNKIHKLSMALRAKIDFDLYDQFVQILALDQAPRNGLLFPEEDLNQASIEKKAFIDTVYQRIDNNTYKFVNFILSKYQFPSSYKLGFYPSGFMALLLHLTAFDNEKSKKILNTLTKLNEQCQFPQKSSILFLMDRQKLYRENKSCCGLLGNKRYSTIENINTADSIRFLYNQIRLKEEVSQGDETSKEAQNELDAKGYKASPYPKNYFCKEKYHLE